MDTQVADPLLGSLIDGRYRVRGLVARGGMATVYSAVDERLERTVALKIIHPSQLGDGLFLDRFTDEAKTIARLTHPNVVAVYDQGTHDGLPYLVMEYVRGRTLREILGERRRLTPTEALAILEQMLAALAAAHRAGLVHRDVKPENVLVAEAPTAGAANLVDCVVKVADFGLARAVEASATDGDGQLMATAAYVAPELVADGRADPRTDVYSAGIVLFEMLTGRVPFDGDQPAVVAWQHVDTDVPPPSRYVARLPGQLDALVARASCRQPDGRPTDAGTLLAEVQAIRDDVSAAEAATAALRPVSDPTMVVSPVRPDQRPPWARLPGGVAWTDRPPRDRHPHEFVGAHQDPPTVVMAPARSPRPGGGRLRHLLAAVSPARVALAALIALLMVFVLGAGWWFGIGRYTVAPELVNLSKADAEQAASVDGFTVEYGESRYSELVARGSILSQDPPGRERIVKGSTITLVVSLGPERYPVPDVVGKSFDLAEAELRNANLTIERGPDRYDDKMPKGVVISVDPKVGAEVEPGATITVTVSKGKAPITVPNVVGKNIAEARSQLDQLDLTVLEELADSDRPAGEVLEQSPSEGTGVEAKAEIRLKVSKGPPLVTVPRVVDLPCPQAQQVLEGAQLKAAVTLNPNGVARFQNPGEGAQVPPGTQVVIGCF